MRYTILMLLFLVGCGGGGGGGGDDGPSAIQACRQYCSFACVKFVLCQFMPPGSEGMCSDTCLNTALELERTTTSCQEAQLGIEALSCPEIGTTFGFTSRGAPDAGRAIGENF